MVAAELAYGVAKSQSARSRAALEMFLAPLDTMTAVHALSLDATLVIHNTREFARVSGLRLGIWVGH